MATSEASARVGAGLVIALLADVSIAARDARIIDGHTRLGVAAGDHAALPSLVGFHDALIGPRARRMSRKQPAASGVAPHWDLRDPCAPQ